MNLRSAIALFFAAILCSLLWSNYYANSKYKSVLLRELTEQAMVSTMTVEEFVITELSAGRVENIQKTIDKIVINRPFIDYIAVSKESQTIDYSSRRGDIGKRAPAGFEKMDSKLYSLLSDGKLSFYKDITYFENSEKKQGKIFVHLNKAYVSGAIELIASDILKSSIAMQAVLFSSLGLLLYIFILSPFKKIVETARTKSANKSKFFIKELNDLQYTLVESFDTLTAQKIRLELLLKTIPELIWLKGRDGVYMFCNPSFEDFFGAKEEEIVGKSDFDFVNKELAEFFRQKDKEAMEKESPSINTEWVTFAVDGRKVFLETIKTPVKDANGEVIGVLGIARDMTGAWLANEKLRQREEIFSAIVTQSSEAIELIDIEGMSFVEFNDAACNGLGYTREEFANLTLADIQADDFDYESMQKTVQEILLTGKATFEHKHKHKNGSIRNVIISNNAITINGKKYFAAVWHDITEQKQYERELEEKVKEETQKRLKQERLLIEQRKMAAMAEMISGIAHNWRQPLNGLGLLIQDIKEAFKYGETTQEYIDATVRKSMEQINQMSKMIDDFRSFTTADVEKNFFEPIELAESVMALLEPQIQGFDIEFETRTLSGAPIVVKSYKNSVKQILSNLLSNAKDAIAEKKKNDQEFEPKIKVTSEIAETDIVRVCVFNNGGNISGETMDRLFEPYFTTKEQGKGVGLGLYMSRIAIEETVGGKITAANKEDGVEFCITIPL